MSGVRTLFAHGKGKDGKIWTVMLADIPEGAYVGIDAASWWTACVAFRTS
jgi:hypothetical protein